MMKKQLPALLAALFMTAFITLVMVVTGANALFNKDGVDPSAAGSSSSISTPNQAQIQQLQNRIDEYAQREQQYQQQIQNDQQILQQAQEQMRQVRRLLSALQERGLIQVQQDGSIAITGGN